ncbi:TauD/TfdA family dioxygenase [Streptacidiphilus albus]|uniref:TauD/TfdA family dioxygenase n=1 Tax=Streptacidiphilus albus TaxID=105425 RepID=UPI000690E4B3|nr:TauD/TfdA family dioxygenase [Streptacidiphilus albus]
MPNSSPSALFRDHLADPRRPAVRARISAQLTEQGLVTMDGLERREQVLGLARVLMKVNRHRDSDPDGLTVIRDTGRHQDRPGFAGLSSAELFPHTEGSALPVPPRLMLLALARAADSGGACVLVDGRAVYDDLLAGHPDAVEVLAEDRAGLFGTGSGTFSPVFAHPGGERIQVRLRLDELARFHPRVEPYLPALRAAIDRHRHALPLRAGQAYLLDNYRWLHARTAFGGGRVAYRALGDPQVGLTLPAGFSVGSALAAEPTEAPALVGGGAWR